MAAGCRAMTLLDQVGPVGGELGRAVFEDVRDAGCGDLDEVLYVRRVVDRLAGRVQPVGAPPAGVHRREPVGQRERVPHGGWAVGRLDMGGDDVVEQQVVALVVDE